MFSHSYLDIVFEPKQAKVIDTDTGTCYNSH